MLEFKRHIINPPLWLSVQVTKLPTTFFMFLRVPLTQLDRWLAFFSKFRRDYRCSQTINAPREDFGIQAVADFSSTFWIILLAVQEVCMMPLSCRTAHYIKELNEDTYLLDIFTR